MARGSFAALCDFLGGGLENLWGYFATGVVSLLVGLASRSFEPKAKLVYWQPHYFLFELQQPRVTLKTDSLTIQNLGRKPAEQTEVVFKTRPDFFALAPAVPYSEVTSPNGEFVLRVESLGPKEFFTLQVLSYATAPTLLNIRSKAGPALPIQIQLQRQFPRWLQLLLAGFTIIGVSYCVYWVVLGSLFLYRIVVPK